MKLTALSRGLLVAAALSLLASLFVPIWQIDLDAPQYPEGLSLQIWASKLSGDVDIINGLNHYIGMKPLHESDFVEFRLLPYLIPAFALLFLATAVVASRKMLVVSLTAFVLFGVVAMADFWKWEYDYGHNLSPDAAIKVPGMAYQPPLIGFRQLLNFGAYSMPHTGGWLFVGAGILLLISLLQKPTRKIRVTTTPLALLAFVLFSCEPKGPDPIRLHQDGCDFCRMKVSDGRFGAEVVTAKGRVYKFDDLSCLLHFAQRQEEGSILRYYVADYTHANTLIDATTAWFVSSPEAGSPMGGNTAAFADRPSAGKQAQQWKTDAVDWVHLRQKISHE